MPSPGDLFLSMLISSIASGYMLYGRRQSSAPALFSGIGLMALPFLISERGLLIGLSLLLMALPVLLCRR